METDRRSNYTTPKTFLELIKLYKNVLLRKRKQTQDNVDRLENGLSKLYKVCYLPQHKRAPAASASRHRTKRGRIH